MWVVELQCKQCERVFKHAQKNLRRGKLPSRCPSCSRERRAAQKRKRSEAPKTQVRKRKELPPVPNQITPNTPAANRARVARAREE